jgi:hypothetical protein
MRVGQLLAAAGLVASALTPVIAVGYAPPKQPPDPVMVVATGMSGSIDVDASDHGGLPLVQVLMVRRGGGRGRPGARRGCLCATGAAVLP